MCLFVIMLLLSISICTHDYVLFCGCLRCETCLHLGLITSSRASRSDESLSVFFCSPFAHICLNSRICVCVGLFFLSLALFVRVLVFMLCHSFPFRLLSVELSFSARTPRASAWAEGGMARIVSTLYLVPSSYAANPSRPRLRSRGYGAVACDVY